jgi:hypothetical protein
MRLEHTAYIIMLHLCPCIDNMQDMWGLQGNVSIVQGGISKDGRDSAVVHYNKTNAVFFRPLEDEMRRVGHFLVLQSHELKISIVEFGCTHSETATALQTLGF